MSEVRNLEPKEIWNHFEDLNAVPRPSKEEERVIEFAKSFGENLGLSTYVDPVGNVIIKKPATPGMENRQTIIMQAHLDMVHQKNGSTDFDFKTQGIQSYIDGEWVKAKGTTLGADNGMGVAAIMSVLASKDLKHPAIEALFTIDEETGMTGAFELEQGILDGTILLNLDTEDDDEYSIGCAGGVDTNTSLKVNRESCPAGLNSYKIVIKGLKGGHSGMDINQERGNANKIMNRLHHEGLKHGLRIVEINGGSLRNAIPRESESIVLADSAYLLAFDDLAEAIKNENSINEPHLEINIQRIDDVATCLSKEDTIKVINAIYSVHNGVYKMSMNVPGLVETSSSLARVIVKDDAFITQSLQRSSVESSKWDIAYTVGACFHSIGAEVSHDGSYPGWSPNKESKILNVMIDLYKNRFNEEPKVKACHAGLECGILGERYPGLDMISFGPTIRNPHSPDEKVNIKSVQKFWGLLEDVLENIPLN